MIRKTALLVTGTVAGVVGVVSYNPPQLNATIAPAGATPQPQTSTQSTTQNSKQTPAQPAPTSSSSKKASSKTTSTTTQNQNTQEVTASPTPAATTKQSSGITGTFKGDTSQTRWGPVQVEITLTNGKITDVTTLQ